MSYQSEQKVLHEWISAHLSAAQSLKGNWFLAGR